VVNNVDGESPDNKFAAAWRIQCCVSSSEPSLGSRKMAYSQHFVADPWAEIEGRSAKGAMCKCEDPVHRKQAMGPIQSKCIQNSYHDPDQWH
jgi:hypothetical protein